MGNPYDKIDTVTKFQEYEYKTKEDYYHITLCIFVLNYKVYITIYDRRYKVLSI